MEQAAELGVFGALKKMTDVFSGWLPVLVIVSLTAGVWLYYLLVSRHEPQHRTLMDCVRRFLRFEALLWPVLGRVLYMSLSVFLCLSGLMTMFLINFFSGLIGMVLLLVLVRILFEMSMMLFTIHGKMMRIVEPKSGSADIGMGMDVAADLSSVCESNGGLAGTSGKAYQEISFLPEDEDLEAQLDAQDEPLLLRKTVLPAEPLVRKDLQDPDVDLPFFSGKRVDKADGPVLK